MSLSADRSSLSRLNKEIADLRTKEAAEVRKAAEASKKVNAAMDSARRASSINMAKTYTSTAEREARHAQTAQVNQSRYAEQAASKIKSATSLQERISKEEERERKKAQDADDKRRRDEDARRRSDEQRQRRVDQATAAAGRAMQSRIAELEEQVAAQLEAAASATPAFRPILPKGSSEIHDVFVSHAWEDKAGFVDNLVIKMKAAGLKVWYDTDAIEWGGSIRQAIDAGLAGSYFGIAVFSPDFFAKPWTNYELDGLLERAASGEGRLLPIWHRLSKDDVLRHAPSLANRAALNTSLSSADDIVAELVKLRDRYRAAAEEHESSEGPLSQSE
ncbi:TIR domain-containing protein [Sphingomonas yunnanensis]|uniref:toll/interleukin-1 receptor domain-containing protein n=1 Tax=Sphingomonas yunnanensis TaxID=310400 RepID=UPI001CA69892|nr:toll/interleukin-1 receptor domain-containing protein [Sphingomonas yunnanensis]MBY9064941.1 TIR domain-containing protein [Sphingomonas yunnanensis]